MYLKSGWRKHIWIINSNKSLHNPIDEKYRTKPFLSSLAACDTSLGSGKWKNVQYCSIYFCNCCGHFTAAVESKTSLLYSRWLTISKVQIFRGAKPVNSYGDVEQVTYDVEIGEQLQSSTWLWLKAYILKKFIIIIILHQFWPKNKFKASSTVQNLN